MKGKTVLITGATDGIGKQTAVELAGMGHEILLHGRNEMRGLLVKNDIILQTGNQNIHYFNADLSEFDEITKLAENIKAEFNHIDVLLNNAGVLSMEKLVLPNGFEQTFMINHLAPFSLTMQLLPVLSNAQAARIVNVSSQAQIGTMDFDNLNGEKFYDGYNAYGLSKLENCLFTYKLARELKESQVVVHALHPGVISTKLLHVGWGSGGAPIETGSRTTVYVSVSEDIEGKTGLYFVNAKEHKSSAISYDQKIQERLWEISLGICKLEDPFRG